MASTVLVLNAPIFPRLCFVYFGGDWFKFLKHTGGILVSNLRSYQWPDVGNFPYQLSCCCISGLIQVTYINDLAITSMATCQVISLLT